MQYYFPGPIETTNIPRNKGLLKYSVNSGESAVRLLLKSFKLEPGDKVALPLFVCDSLKTALTKEGLQPVYLDIKENSFWTNYDQEQLKMLSPKAIILVHLYGFIHPDVKLVIAYCKENNIPLIHDMAQCYGANEALLTYGDIMYSFGPGKSTTAAGGGLIKSIDNGLYSEVVKKVSWVADIKAGLFFKSRVYGYKYSTSDKIMAKLTSKFSVHGIEAMSQIQKDAAEYVMGNMENIHAKRRERYGIIKDAIKDNSEINIAYDDGGGLYFKAVLMVKGDVAKFRRYLFNNHVPCYSLFDSITVGLSETADKPWFILNAKRFVEISIEASLPLGEVKRVGDLLQKYKP